MACWLPAARGWGSGSTGARSGCRHVLSALSASAREISLAWVHREEREEKERFKSVGVLDEEALLAICAYIDLNPVAAGIVEVPEESPHTAVTARVEHVKAQGPVADLKAAEGGSAAGSNASGGLEESIWLCPIEDLRKPDSSREGMVEGFSLGSYLLLVDYTGRLFREGKTAISTELAGILARLGTSAEGWQARLEKLKSGRLLGRFFAASRERLREIAARLRLHHIANLGGCPAR